MFYFDHTSRRGILSVLLIFFSIFLLEGQDVYKTPSGERYHKASCRMVENVSSKLVNEADIAAAGLTPCKICKPPLISVIQYGRSPEDKSVGEGAAIQCKGTTQQGKQCQHTTKLGNGYCYQHTAQNSNSYTPPVDTPSSHPCGARTQSGGACKRSVRVGVYCYQHGG